MKRVLKAFWRGTGRLRSPFQRKLSAFLTGCVARALDDRNLTRAMTEELSQTLDALVAEHFRLQEQVEALRRQVEAIAPPPPGPGSR